MNEDLLKLGVTDFIFVPAFLILCFVMFPVICRRLAPGHAPGLTKLVWLRMAGLILVFAFMVTTPSADCHSYWRGPAQGELFTTYGEVLGTGMVEILMYPFAYWFKLSFFSCFLPFAALGSIGTLLLGATVIHLRQGDMTKLTWVLLALPNCIFWSSAPGKDVMMWFFGSLLLYTLFCMRGGLKGITFLLFSLAGMFAFRPHVAIASILALLPVLLRAPHGVVWLSRYRIGVFVFCLIGLLVAIPLAKDYLRVEDFTDVSAYTERFKASGELYSAENEGEASSIDLTGASPPMRMVAFMFRPLFFDANGLMGVLASLENLLLLVLTILIIFKRRFWWGLLNRDFLISAPLYLWCFSWIMLSMSGGNNLGLFARQKVQLMPFWILLMCLLATRKFARRAF